MAQLKDTTIDGSLLVSGAATFEDVASTRQGLNFLGTNPHGGIDNDTIAKWTSLGSGWGYISGSEKINNQPYSNGFIENRVTNGGLVSQTFTTMSGSGEMYHREGSTAYDWYAGSKDWIRIVDKKFVNKSLWSGSWASGNITVSDTENYTMFLIKMSGQGTLIPAFKNGEYIRGVGGYVNTTPTDFTYHFAATVSGNTWTFVGCDHMWHGSESVHGARTLDTVTGIYGLI